MSFADGRKGPPRPQRCDHFFQDTNHCVKCGWTPEPDAGTISLLTKRIYVQYVELVDLRARGKWLEEKLQAATAMQDLRAETADGTESVRDTTRAEVLIAAQRKIASLRTIVEHYLAYHTERSFAKICECKICLDARKVLRNA